MPFAFSRRVVSAIALTIVLALSALIPLASSSAASVLVQTPDRKETVALTFLRPSDFVAVLKEAPDLVNDEEVKAGRVPLSLFQSIKGLRGVSPRDLDAVFEVEGTPEAIAEVKSLAQMLDLAPREASITLSVMRVHLNANGARERTVVGKARITTTNNATALVDVGGKYRLSVTPHINGDNSISLAVSGAFPESGKMEGISSASQQFVRVKSGDKRRFRFAAAAARPETRAQLSRKDEPFVTDDDRTFEQAFKNQAAVVYYVDVTAIGPPVAPPVGAVPAAPPAVSSR